MTTFDTTQHPRIANGTFTDKEQSAPETVLGSSDSAFDRIVAVYQTRGYYADQAARQLATRYLGEAAAAGIDGDFLADYIELVDGQRSDAWTSPSAAALHAAGQSPADLRAVLEHTDGKFASHAAALLAAGVTADRIDELTAAGVPPRADALIAFSTTEMADVRAWVDAVRDSEDLRKWVAAWPIIAELHTAGITPAVAAEYTDSGLDAHYLALSGGQITAAESRDFTAKAGLDPLHVSRYLLHNADHVTLPERQVSAADAKKFGPNFEPDDAATLIVNGVAPRAARSLRGASRYLPVAHITELADAGVVTGAEYKAFRDLTGGVAGSSVGSGRSSNLNSFNASVKSEIKRIVAAKKSGATPTAAATYVKNRLHNPEQWKVLHDAGVVDLVAFLAPSAGTSRANSFAFERADDREKVAADAIAAFATAGGTGERLAVIQRAGIPVTHAHEHVHTEDLWPAGAVHRAALLEADTARSKRWGSGEAEPWEWDESTYRG